MLRGHGLGGRLHLLGPCGRLHRLGPGGRGLGGRLHRLGPCGHGLGGRLHRLGPCGRLHRLGPGGHSLAGRLRGLRPFGGVGAEPGQCRRGPQVQPRTLGREHRDRLRAVLGRFLRRLRSLQSLGGLRLGAARGRQREGTGGLGRLDLQQSAPFQGGCALGLGRGVAAQQSRVLVAQPGQLRALGTQPLLQLGAQLARLLQVGLQFGDALLEAPLVAGTRAREVGDLLARRGVPAAHHDGADDCRRRGGSGQRAQHRGLGEHPGTQRADDGDTGDHRRRQHPVQRWGMAVASTWHGQKLTARRRIVGPCLAKTPRHRRLHEASAARRLSGRSAAR